MLSGCLWYMDGARDTFFVSILENKKFSSKIVSYEAKSTIVRVRIVNPECDYGKGLKCKWPNSPVALQIAIWTPFTVVNW